MEKRMEINIVEKENVLKNTRTLLKSKGLSLKCTTAPGCVFLDLKNIYLYIHVYCNATFFMIKHKFFIVCQFVVTYSCINLIQALIVRNNLDNPFESYFYS